MENNEFKNNKTNSASNQLNMSDLSEAVFQQSALGFDYTNLENTLREKNALLQSILDHAPLGIWISNPVTENNFSNKFVEMNFALTKEEVQQCKNTDYDAIEKNEPQRYEEMITFKDGTVHILESLKTKLYREDGSLLGVLGFGVDITKRKEGEEALRISESKYRLLTEATSDVIWILNTTTNRLTYISPTVESLIGFSVEETIHMSLEEMLSPISYKKMMELICYELEEFKKAPNVSKSSILEVELACKNGKYIWVEISARLRFNSNHEVEVVGVSRNIEQRKKYEKEVLYLSYHDQLTGLYNRRFYEEELKRINVEDNYPISLVMADVNGLKLTNDAFGHILGDRLLITFADILKQECRSGDIIARIGGDEFVLLLPRANSIQAEKIVERIRGAVSKTVIDKVLLSVSFGWKTKYTQEESFDEVYKLAEDAMYRNKLMEGKSYKSDTIKMITKSLYEKCPKEQLHCQRVSNYCKSIGMAMGMSASDINELGLVGLLHDIGKIGINERILNKNNNLTPEEQEEKKRHAEIGYHILRAVNEYADIAEYVLAHHERLDGKGYPKGLKNDDIPLKSQILMVAEAYDEMTCSKEYEKELTAEEAVEELKKNIGIHYDRGVVNIFIEQQH